MRAPVLAFAFAISVVAAGCGGGSGKSTTDYLCQPACPTGMTCTANGCVSTTDAAALPPGADMAGAGGCAPACSGSTPFCNNANTCVGCLADSDCAKGQLCHQAGLSAFCVPGCTDDNGCASGKCCSGMCLDTSSDPGNCGACGTACMSTNAGSACQGGACVTGTCNPGYGDCDNDPSTGCEANISIDPKNCGACGNPCKIANALSGCASTCYIKACNFGYDDCDGKVENGCETPVISDPKNCGACGNGCAGFPNASAACINSSCGIKSCNNGFADCDANIANGCEINTTNDVKNCGACGNFCGQGLICVGGACTCPMCNGLYPHASAKCVNLQCSFDACNPGWADCDNNVVNGCEVDIINDPKNCGACNNACGGMTPYCDTGKCTDKPLAIPGFAGELGPDYRSEDFVQCLGILDKLGSDDLPLNWVAPCADMDYKAGKIRLVCGKDANNVRYIDVSKNVFITKLLGFPERGLIEKASWTMNLPSNDIYGENGQNDVNGGRSWWVTGDGCGEGNQSITINNICQWDVANCFGQNLNGDRYFYVYMKK